MPPRLRDEGEKQDGREMTWQEGGEGAGDQGLERTVYRRGGGEGFILSSCSLSACVSLWSTTGCFNNAAAIFLVSAHVYLIESLPQPA